MGYYTSFTLTASSCTISDGRITTSNPIPKITLQGLEDEIEKMNVFECGDYKSGYYANTKWYDWEDDMRLLSKRFPEILFCLHGEGEASDDLWEAYFFEGKCQHCPATITYDDFDPDKLLAKKVEDEKYSYE